MSIQEISQKFKHFFEDTELFTAALLILVAGSSFVLGQLSAEHTAMQNAPERGTGTASVVMTSADEGSEIYVGSKNSDKYHLPWCSGAQRIKEENKVVFASKVEAEEAGYEPAGNCKGI